MKSATKYSSDSTHRKSGSGNFLRYVVVLGSIAALILGLSIIAGSAYADDCAADSSCADEQTTYRSGHPFIPSTNPPTWTLDTPLPGPRGGASVAVVGNFLYEAGGHTTGFPPPPVNTAARFDGSSWSAIASMPVPVHSAAAASDGSRFYAIGGFLSNGNYSTQVQVYNPSTDSWSMAAPLPSSMGGASAVYYDGRIYVFGSCSSWTCNDFLTTHWIYNVANNTWSPGASLPQGVGYPAVEAIGQHIYVAGGLRGFYATNKAYRYDPATNSWNDAAMADLPQARGVSGFAEAEGKIYVYGGYVDPGGITNSMVIYDVATNSWTSGPNLNVATWWLGSDIYQGSLYAVGGDQQTGGGGTVSRVEKLTLDISSPPPTPTQVPPTPTPVVTPTPMPCTPGRFTDVPSDHTFYPFVTCLVNRGIISGYADCTFRPGNEVTRGQLSKIVANAAGMNEPVSGQRFSDVPPSHPFYEFIERMASRGVIGGYADGTFQPGNPATRGQISKIVANAANMNEPVSGQRFSDVPPTHTFYQFIERMAGRGIISGYADGTFRPGANATRGQVSKIVANAFFPTCGSR